MTRSFLLAIALWIITNQKSNEDLYEIFGEFSIVLWFLYLEGHLIYFVWHTNLPNFPITEIRVCDTEYYQQLELPRWRVSSSLGDVEIINV